MYLSPSLDKSCVDPSMSENRRVTVPLGKARLRVMNSAAHSSEDLSKALAIFAEVGRALEVID